ncbi:signal-transduction regulatory protein [Salinisphaera sp. T5B8]|uniref:sigma 54-interacting transcriptional regulator n=1 Tax=Salinisphaera sp. T5B8 TaxID=1304154 RepID=UPI00333E5DDB
MFEARRNEGVHAGPTGQARVAVHVDARIKDNRALRERIEQAIAPRQGLMLADALDELPEVAAVFALYPEVDALEALARQVRDARARRGDGRPVLVVGLSPDRLTLFGGWLMRAAAGGEIDGLRLIVDRDPNVLVSQLGDYLEAVHEPSVIAVPGAAQAQGAHERYFFCLSPAWQAAMSYVAELAENHVARIGLLGEPGVGKSAMAYFYYLCRGRGEFIKLNLAAEVGDTPALKALLCGEVTAAQSRTGALAQARTGVCFIDAFQGRANGLADVLDEALDSGEYLPHGAAAKQPLDCALVFAATPAAARPLPAMPAELPARLAAQPVYLPSLRARGEDLIAIVAATLDTMRTRSTTWQAPAGLSHAAWQALCNCPWRGNARSLERVMETAFISAATARTPLIERDAIDSALALWEPESAAAPAT